MSELRSANQPPANRRGHPLRRLLASNLAQAMATPHSVDRYLQALNPRWSVETVHATVTDVQPQTHDMLTLVLKPNWNWAGFAAGQFVQLGVEIDGVRYSRCFSPANSTHRADGHIELCFKAHADGFVTQYLLNNAKVGMHCTLSPAMGEFYLPEQRPERLLLISGGSGITPVLAMLRTLLDEGHSGRITFLHYARSAQDLPYADALADIEDAHANVEVIRVFTDVPAGGDANGFFSPEQIAKLVPDHAEATSFLCGPPGLMDNVSAHWTEIGAADRLHSERFTLTPTRRADASPSGDVHFAKSERYAANNGDSLLDQAEAAGLRPQSGCRMGICATCTCRKTAGVVRNLQTGQLSGPGEESIRICISAPEGDVTLDI